MANPKNELLRLRAKQAKLLQGVARDLAKQIRSVASDTLSGLSGEDAAIVLNSVPVKSALANLGTSKPVKAVASKPARAKRTRRTKVGEEQILEYLKTERTSGEIGKALGQLIPKRVVQLVRDGKVTLRKDGVKKLYKAK